MTIQSLILLVIPLLYSAMHIEIAFGRSIPNQSKVVGVFKDDSFVNQQVLNTAYRLDFNSASAIDSGSVTSISISLFSDILFKQLVKNNSFRKLFSNPVSEDLLIDLGLAVAQSIAIETGLKDTYLSTNLIKELTSVNPSAGSEAFGRALSIAIGKILTRSDLLKSTHVTNLATKFTKLINKAAIAVLQKRVELNLDAKESLGVSVQDPRNHLSNANKNSKILTVLDSTGTLDLPNSNWDFGLHTLNANNELVDANIRTNDGLYINTGNGVQDNLNIDAGLGVGTDVGLKPSADVRLGFNTGVELENGAGEEGSSKRLRPGVDNGGGIRAGVDLGLRRTTDLKTSAIFKTRLTRELLRDRAFRYLFSNSIPELALYNVASAICQHLAKLFSFSRATLLQLESNIIHLSKTGIPLVQDYANVIASTLLSIFKTKKLITSSTCVLKGTIAAKAVSSAITNFLSISTISGVGLSTSNTVYNSYFSVLNGLGKLPYVGIDIASQTLPPSLKTAKASAFASQFAKLMYHNLISSSKFSQSFLLGIFPSAYKLIANSVGSYMAEAFGSPNLTFFATIYFKALLATGKILNYKRYAKTISLATTKILYLLGYFLSGNANFQAAIATNAIVRALSRRYDLGPVNAQITSYKAKHYRILYPDICDIPLNSQLRGISPAEILENLKTSFGVDISRDISLELSTENIDGIGFGTRTNFGANVDVVLNPDDSLGDAEFPFVVNNRIRSEWGIGARDYKNIGTVLGSIYANLLPDIELNSAPKSNRKETFQNNGQTARGKRRFNSKFDDFLNEIDADLYLKLDTKAHKKAELDLGIQDNLGTDFYINAELGFGLDSELQIDDKTGIYTGVKTGLDLDTNAILNAILDHGTNAQLGVDTNGRLIHNNSPELDLGVNGREPAGVNTRLDTGLDAGVSTSKPNILNLSIVDVISKLLANKMYHSTALYTSISIEGIEKVVNLIAQSMSVEFGFEISSVFLKCFYIYIRNTDNSFDQTMGALGSAITNALAAAGIFNTKFSVANADQLATAVVFKLSSLMATSLDTRNWNRTP